MKHATIISCIRTMTAKTELVRGSSVKGMRYTVMTFTSCNGGKTYRRETMSHFKTRTEADAGFRSLVHPVTLALYEGLCRDHGGKMSGVVSFSTLCDINPRCIERMKAGNSICAHCFAHTQLKRQASHRAKLARNTAIITASVYSASYFPIIDDFDLFRFESFGDLINPVQAANYMTWAAVNKRMACALWTKNPDIMYKAINEGMAKKPHNLNIVYSSPAINVYQFEASC